MSQLIATCPDTVSDRRGLFHARLMAEECASGSWEAWVEFVSIPESAASRYVTPPETRQQDRAAIALWASGITRVYLEGALARAKGIHPEGDQSTATGLMQALQEIVETLDRRLPDVTRAGEAVIAGDAARLRLRAVRRLAGLTAERRSVPNGTSVGIRG